MARFRSKRDPWAVALLLAGAVGAASAAALLLMTETPLLAKCAYFVICLGAASFLVSLLVRTYYDLDHDRLEVRHGPLRWSIPVSEITSVAPERSMASSAALSMDRFKIEFGPSRSTLEVSPADRSGFLAALAAESTGLELRGNALVRRSSV